MVVMVVTILMMVMVLMVTMMMMMVTDLPSFPSLLLSFTSSPINSSHSALILSVNPPVRHHAHPLYHHPCTGYHPIRPRTPPPLPCPQPPPPVPPPTRVKIYPSLPCVFQVFPYINSFVSHVLHLLQSLHPSATHVSHRMDTFLLSKTSC